MSPAAARFALLTLVLLLLAVSVALSAAGDDDGNSGAATHRKPPILWGMAGPYESGSLSDLRRRNVRVTLLELDWERAEPVEGQFDDEYFGEALHELERQLAGGYQVVLNFGLHDAPRWLLERPNGRLVNQFGDEYRERPQANLIFATELRPYGERYVAEVFRRLGTRFYAVRVGGGPRGELSYPSVVQPATGRIHNYYYAFDGAAARVNPVPHWKPCDPSPNNEAQRFLDWYLDALAEYQTWQIETVRRRYRGHIAVLYASFGMRPGDASRAVATNLCGASSAELNGEVQRGFDHARMVAAVRDPGVGVWGTWGDRPETLNWLRKLADAHDPPLRKFGENSGEDDLAGMRASVNGARRNRLTSFMWIRDSQAQCRCEGWATIDDYERLIKRTSR